MTAPAYVLGVDLGQAQDYTAWVVAERTEVGREAQYDVRHIDRVRGARYPAIVGHTRELIAMLRAQEPRPEVSLVLDYTGVGRPVADMFLGAGLTSDIQLVTITGGDAVQRGEGGELRTPKRDLASTIQVVLQDGRLRISETLPHAQTLVDELTNFRVTIRLTGHDTYGAGAEWREGNHDDLVLALALALWWGERMLVGSLMT